MAKKITETALFAAVALIVSVIEAQFPPLVPIPGLKLGIANIVTLFAILVLGPRLAFSVLMIRILLGALLTGRIMALAYSLSGGLLAFFVVVLLYRFFTYNNIWMISVISAVFHNIGQLATAMVITSTSALAFYLPLLIISGIVTGVCTGLCTQSLLHRLKVSKAIPYVENKPASFLNK